MDLTGLPPLQEDSLLYAKLLGWATHAGLALLSLAFAAYVLGLLPPFVPLDQLPALWSQPVDKYLQMTASPQLWGWVPLAARGDFSNLIGIAILAGASLPPLAALVILFIRQREFGFAVICTCQAGLLLLAASGVLNHIH